MKPFTWLSRHADATAYTFLGLSVLYFAGHVARANGFTLEKMMVLAVILFFIAVPLLSGVLWFLNNRKMEG